MTSAKRSPLVPRQIGHETEAERDACPPIIYIIDFIRWSEGHVEPEIVSRLIHHAANLDEAQEHAKCLLKGVNFLNVQAFRILDRHGFELYSRALPCDP